MTVSKTMAGNAEWELKDASHKVVGENQLRSYGHFLEEHDSQLKRFEEVVGDADLWDLNLQLVTIKFAPHEHTTFLKLLNTENIPLSKTLTAFATLCSEAKIIEFEAREKHFNSLMFYGETGEEFVQDGLAHTFISHFLPYLQELLCFVNHCKQVALNIIEQLHAFFSPWCSQFINTKDIHVHDVVEHLATILVVLMTLDEILTNQNALSDHWSLYKQTLKSVYHEPEKFGIDQEKVKIFESVLFDLEDQLIKGKLLINFFVSVRERNSEFKMNSKLLDELNFYVKNGLSDLESKPSEQFNHDQGFLWLKLCIIYVLNFHVCGTIDKKQIKQIWDQNKKVPCVTLVGNLLWLPEQFLISHLPDVSITKLIDKKVIELAQNNRSSYLQQKTQTLQKDVQQLSIQVCSWAIETETILKQTSENLKIEDLNHRCNAFLQGIQHASFISYTLKSLTNLHVSLAKPMLKIVVISLCRLIELLKSIQHLYSRHCTIIAESVNHIVQYLSFQILSVINTTMKNISQDKRFREKHPEVLSSLKIAKTSLNGPSTRERRLIARLALTIANQRKVFRDEDLVLLSSLLRKLDLICELDERVMQACNCEFLFWHRVILPIYFKHLFENKTDFHRLMYMFGALQDYVAAVSHMRHCPSSQQLVENIENQIRQDLNQLILQPLCHDIETNLRLHVHSHLQLDDRNPFRIGVFDSSPLLKLNPVRCFDKFVNIRSHIEHYLNETFYNLTTVALHDWKTYGEMRALARYKYDLVTIDDHLPSQTLEQGLDVLEIMRNIHIFVSKYLYNLNNQIFIEQSSNNKHLNTINIRHIANSIRTHGTGIMNTTVNFTYQFLRKKFYIFSQFMYDEHIKSRLIKDLRHFRENKTQLSQKYSYERADKFNRGIRKLGLTADGKSYLDQFRLLITHIGNAMGYVRMIRSGGLHCCSNAICFIPDLEDIMSFEELCEQDNLSDMCKSAAHRLDAVISNLTSNFAEGTEYFKLLVDVFSPVFRDPKNMHLKNFYVIVPPLTINFIEYSITCKEKMSKKNKSGAAFTDDGFAMGIAYILKLLDQYPEFDSLHWFQSVKDHYSKEKSLLKKQESLSSKDDEKLQQTMTLTARRLDIYQHEFDLLYYSLSSARIFFKDEKKCIDDDDLKS